MAEEPVKEYFSKTAEEFDNIYEHRGDIVTRLINRFLRRGMYRRVAMTVLRCGDVRGKTVLDIGCGSGRVSLILAQRGAKVVGIDYASGMIELAQRRVDDCLSGETKIDVTFRCCDFLTEFEPSEAFDITLALGVFDYVSTPEPLLGKMRELTREKMLASFPSVFAPQAVIRKIWLATRGCPVHYYHRGQLAVLYNTLGLKQYQIMGIPAGYLVEAIV